MTRSCLRKPHPSKSSCNSRAAKDAEIFIDQRPLPLENERFAQRLPGAHTLRAKASGFQRYDANVYIPDSTNVLHIPLLPEKEMRSRVHHLISPAGEGNRVLWNGKVREALTDGLTEFEPGPYDLFVSREGF